MPASTGAFSGSTSPGRSDEHGLDREMHGRDLGPHGHLDAADGAPDGHRVVGSRRR